MSVAVENCSFVPYSERELIQRAIRNARPVAPDRHWPRWQLVKYAFGVGREVSVAICWKYGFDPDAIIRGRDEL